MFLGHAFRSAGASSRIWIVLLILAVLGVVAMRLTQTRQQESGDGHEQGRLQLTRQFWDTYKQASQKRAAGDLETAASLYQKALQLKPQHEDSLYYLGNCFLELSRYQEAIDTNLKLIAVNPLGSSRGYMQLGLIYSDLDPRAPFDLEKASQYFQRTLEVDPDSGAMLGIAEVAMLRGNWQKARESLLSVNTDSPMSMAAPYLLGFLSYRKGDKLQAWQWFHLAVQRGELKKPQLKWTEEGDIKADPELRWRALARQSVFGKYWLPMRKYLNDSGLSPTVMEAEYQRFSQDLALKSQLGRAPTGRAITRGQPPHPLY